MPISTNAPFNNLGHTMVLRDIEQLWLSIQDLQTSLGAQPSGDLNPGGGQQASQQVPDSTASGTPTDSGSASTGPAFGASGLCSGTAATTFITASSPYIDTDAGWDGAHTFTAPASGVYRISCTAAVNLFGSGGDVFGVTLRTWINASTFFDLPTFLTIQFGQANAALTFTGVYPLTAGDTTYWQIALTNISGGSLISMHTTAFLGLNWLRDA